MMKEVCEDQVIKISRTDGKMWRTTNSRDVLWRLVCDVIIGYNWRCQDVAVITPDMNQADFFLFPKLKRNLKGHHFNDVPAIQAARTRVLKWLSKDCLSRCLPRLRRFWFDNLKHTLHQYERFCWTSIPVLQLSNVKCNGSRHVKDWLEVFSLLTKCPS